MDHHMAAQQGPVGQDIVVTQNTVVSDMGTRHQKVSVAEDRVFFHPIRAVHGHMFSKHVIVTDEKSSGLAGVFEVLGRVSENSPSMDAVAGSQSGMARQIGTGADLAMRPQDHMAINDRMRADLAAFAELGRGMDDGCGVDDSGHRRVQRRNPTTQPVM